MKTSYIYLLSLIVVAGFCRNLQAQEAEDKKEGTLSRELTIEREFVPMVRDASKINVLPAIEAPQIKKTNIRYSDWAMPILPASQLTVLPAVGTDVTYPFSNKKGYVDFGMGNYWNINGDAGYHILDTEKDQLFFWLQHHSSNGNVNYIDRDGKNKLKQNDNQVNLLFRHEFSRLAFFLDLKYRYNLFNYYGHTVLNDADYSRFDPSGLTDFGKDQVAQQLGFQTGVEANDEDEVYYKVDLGYNRYTNKFGFLYGEKGGTENQVRAGLEMASRMSAEYRIGLRAQVESLFYENMDSTKNYTMVSLNPYFNIGRDRFNLRLGINADITFNQGTLLRMSPDVRMDWEFADAFFFYLGAKGGKTLNTFAHLTDETIYFNPSFRPVDAYVPVDATLGFRSNYFNGFWFDIYAGYKMIKDDALGMGFGYGAISPTSGRMSLSRNAVSYYSADTKDFYAGVNLRYSYNQRFDLGVRLQFNNWEGDSEIIVTGRPKMEVGFNGTVHFTRELSLDVDYYLATDRKYVASTLFVPDMPELQDARPIQYDSELTSGKLKNINALGLRANYQITDFFNVYVKANNVLAQKYDFWYGMPAQRFSVMGGIGFKF